MLAETTRLSYGFTGREADAETGLYHFRARAYDAAAGRFLQSDPIGFAAGDLNTYAYTWNDPYSWSDPSGLTSTAPYAANTATRQPLERDAVLTIYCGAFDLGADIISTLNLLGAQLNAGAAGTVEDAGGYDLNALEVASRACGYVMMFMGRPRLSKCGLKRFLKSGLLMVATGAVMSGITDLLGNSFEEGTLVRTEGGLVPIEDIRVGDLVYARHDETGEPALAEVTGLMAHEVAGLTVLHLEAPDGAQSELRATDKHPLRVGGEWVLAGDLMPGDMIEDSAGQPLRVVAMTLDMAPTRVHNLEVAGAHTYFAGAFEAWVHNGFGAYEINFSDGSTYIGKGDACRCNRSSNKIIKQNPGISVTSKNLVTATSDRDSFIFEDMMICAFGGIGSPGLRNKINSPGRRY